MPEVITIDEMRSLIKKENLKPSDLFSNSDLMDDPAVKGFTKDAAKEAAATNYARFKETEEKFEAEKKKWEEEKKKTEEDNLKLKKDVAKINAGETLFKLIDEGKFDDKKKEFLNDQFKKFAITDVEKVEEEVKKFVEEKSKEHDELAKHFGVAKKEPEKEEKEETEEEKKPGSEPETGSSEEDNPFITKAA